MEKLGRYQLMEIIGEGAMARVYKALDPEITRTLAVKLLKTQLASDDKYRARFLREAKGAGVLSHPNIVTIYDVGIEDGHPYIAEELVEGDDARRRMRSGRSSRRARSSTSGSSSRARSTTRTARASSIATSSRATSCSSRTPPR